VTNYGRKKCNINIKKITREMLIVRTMQEWNLIILIKLIFQRYMSTKYSKTRNRNELWTFSMTYFLKISLRFQGQKIFAPSVVEKIW
jgi:hypothetical protein